MKMLSIVAALPLFCTLAAAAPAQPRISAQRMSDITRVLASDAFEGRSMGTRGEDLTVAYRIAQYKAAGLEPGG
jgi:hypothetical protein